MKRIIILLFICSSNFISIMAQTNYEDQWKKVQEFDQQGLPKSALEIVETIRNQAQKDQNVNQSIKALIFQSKYMLDLEENAQLNIISNFKKAIAETSFPEQNLLENMLASLYWQYFEQNRWRFYNRTKTAQKVDQEDFRTWDLETLFEEVHYYYQKSLENGVLAQQTDLSKFDVLLDTYKGAKDYRPSLFDFLAHNALIFYKTSETNISRPSYAFELDDPSYISPHQEFIRKKIETKDTLSLQFQALKIYKSLINFHAKANQALPLATVNIERLNFIHQHGVFPDKQEVLLATLEKEKDAVISQPVSTLYDYQIASQYQSKGTIYEPKANPIHQWKLTEAIQICEAAIKRHPDSRGANNCQYLIEEIKSPYISSIRSEKIVPSAKSSKLLLSYKNVDNIYLKIYRTTPGQLKKLRELYSEEDRLAYFKKLTATKEWSTKLKNEKDFQNHSIELIVPELKTGHYLILATTKPDISEGQTFGFTDFQVSDLVLTQLHSYHKMIFQVVDRNNGAPVQDVKIHLYADRGNRNRLDLSLKTDQDGKAEFNQQGYYYDTTITLTKGEDRLILSDFYLNLDKKRSDNTPDYRENTHLFTDRSIYRPGQTLYFKGIVFGQLGDEKPKILTDKSIFVTLRDANGQEVSKLELKTNAYGSVAGEFILPSTGLTGEFHIESGTNGYAYFSVEEYKRPKFEATFNPINEVFKVEDSVKVQGTARAYAGSMISDAKVTYKVTRSVQYPSWCYWYPPYDRTAQEIAQGETETDASGNFEISFIAIPDKTLDKKNYPTFIYEVTADITDINGETRSARTTAQVGYHALTAMISVPNTLILENKKDSVSINTLNLNGQPTGNQGKLTMHKLEAPDYVLRKRPWNAPDYHLLDKKAFKELFPHEAFENEDSYVNWKKGEEVWSTSYNTKDEKSLGNDLLSLSINRNWKPGIYILELSSTDQFGEPIKAIAYTTLIPQKKSIPLDKELFSIKFDKGTYKPGEEALLTFSSAAKDITVFVTIEKKNQIVQNEKINLSENSKQIKIPITEEDRGGFGLTYSFVQYNSYQSGSRTISVPYEPIDLQITTKTFRDKLEPGQQETWSFTVKGPKGDAVNAELLASMYDQSLDQFKPHSWYFRPINQPHYYSGFYRQAKQSFGIDNFILEHYKDNPYTFQSQPIDRLNWFGFYFNDYYAMSKRRMMRSAAPMEMSANMVEDEALEEVVMESEVAGAAVEKRESDTSVAPVKDKKEEKLDVTPRKNLQETAFFFPQLSTDEKGNVTFSFTTPEALTQWKLQLLAHSKNLETASQSFQTLTQKDLMVLPNPPRFLREGDELVFSTKIANISDQKLQGVAELQLIDGLTGKAIHQELGVAETQKSFTVDASGNTQVSWKLQIPKDLKTVQYTILAKAGDFSDGEQNLLPVLTNRMLVTETLPMWIRSNETKTFTLDKLRNTTSNTLSHHKLTLEMTSNPAWYAVQSLPYLMEYPYECAEQTFSRYYANSLATHIANSNPRIKEVFRQWENTDALLSNLEKNQELKSLILQETPWLRDAQSETEQKKRIALLFDLNKMNREMDKAFQKLAQLQFSSGAFPWFKGGRENRYITQHIVSGFGHLKQLNVKAKQPELQAMIKRAIPYLDQEFKREYEELKRYCKKHKIDMKSNHLSSMQIHYLYMRSFFKDIKRASNTNEAWSYYMDQVQRYWLKNSIYNQGMLALILQRNEVTSTAKAIIASLEEKSITSDELGMYWKSNRGGWFWYQAPIETQALLIEAFGEIQEEPKRTKNLDEMKIWLLKNKQTNKWETTKATTEAVYALLLQGSDWISVTDMVDITLGGKPISPSKLEDVKVEAGTGYFKTSWNTTEVTPELASATLTKKGKGIAWGALYWQYFEDLDKITPAETPLKLKKKLFLKKNTDRGEQLTEITPSTPLAVGDLIRVRIELRSDRDMEFIHMKDMRASGLEPVSVLSQYRWQDGLGYYESTKDAATNFFFDVLPKGVYVFEYDLRVNNKGDFSNGITTIQSMYAPEFSSHSEGVRVLVNE